MRDPTTQFHSQTPGQAARRRLKSVAAEPLFLAAWKDVVFLHFEPGFSMVRMGRPQLLKTRRSS